MWNKYLQQENRQRVDISNAEEWKSNKKAHETHSKIEGFIIQGIYENILKLTYSIKTSDWQKFKRLATSIADRKVGARVLPYIAGEKMNCLSYYWNTSWYYQLKFKMHIWFDPQMLLLGICSMEMKA